MRSERQAARESARLAAGLRRDGIRDRRVLAAIAAVPRHEFVPPSQAEAAYADMPLPIGEGQTISQPYIVALMTELLELEPGERVLEVGTGCGYQTAVLAAMGCEVFSIERIGILAAAAAERLARLGYRVHTRTGDGFAGWPEQAPFDAILVTAAPPRIPSSLTDQLAVNGRLVIPIGARHDVHTLTLVRRRADGTLQTTEVAPVRFVPMLPGVD